MTGVCGQLRELGWPRGGLAKKVQPFSPSSLGQAEVHRRQMPDVSQLHARVEFPLDAGLHVGDCVGERNWVSIKSCMLLLTGI